MPRRPLHRAPPEDGARTTNTDGKLGRTDAPALPLGDKALDEAILPRVERNDHQPPTRCEEPFRRLQRPPETAQFVVYPDPHGLKDPLGRVAALLLPAHGCPHGLVQIRRNLKRSSSDYLPGHTPGLAARHVPVLREYPCKLSDLDRVQILSRRYPRARVHSHVQRPLTDVGEPAFRLVHLKTGEPEVEKDRISTPTFLRHCPQHFVVGTRDELEARVLKKPGRPPGRFGVPVDADEATSLPELIEYPPGVAATTEGGVYDRIFGTKPEGGHRLLQHHGTVSGRHHPPRSLPANSSTISENESSAPLT